ncbi:hypothetical protein WH47_03229 [Habropoda laboriosa]|uniref:Uncharacterized protein n=1 Tax=Habropoda laboriosa TaxID=597456 RepID=A0A0L7RBE6_9HYME|nr:hypothetical protein WH47_03229 [Habropoda laboriosa]
MYVAILVTADASVGKYSHANSYAVYTPRVKSILSFNATPRNSRACCTEYAAALRCTSALSLPI